MFCNYCGTKNPDDGSFCSKCGKSLVGRITEVSSNNSTPMHTVEIFRESQMFVINPPINISINGKKNLSIANGENVTLQLDDGHYEFVFSQSFRKKALSINLTQNIHINLKWNRITGSLEVAVSEQ